MKGIVALLGLEDTTIPPVKHWHWYILYLLYRLVGIFVLCFFCEGILHATLICFQQGANRRVVYPSNNSVS